MVGVAPEWMSEKAIAIGCYFVASGIDVVTGHPFYIEGSKNVTSFLNGGAKEVFGASFHVHEDPIERRRPSSSSWTTAGRSSASTARPSASSTWT